MKEEKQDSRCPTLNWRSLTNYLDFIGVLESQANMKFPHNEIEFEEGSNPHQWTLKTSDQKRFSVNLLFRRYVETCCTYFGTQTTPVPKNVPDVPEVPDVVPAKLIASSADYLT